MKHYVNPRFSEQIDVTKIKPAPTHLFGKENDERIVDLVFECPLRYGDGSLLAVIVFEHQTASLKEIPLKLLKYITSIWDKEKKAKKPQSVPYFIVLRTGKKPHRKPYPQLADFFPKDVTGQTFGTVPRVEYEVVDLPAWDFRKLIGKPELRLVLGMLKKMSEGVLDDFPEACLPIREFRTLQEQADWFREILPFAAKVFSAHNRKLEIETLNKTAKKVFDERAKNMMATIFDEVEARGEARGKAEGETRALLRFLGARFKHVPKRVSDRISRIGDLVVLDSLTVQAATCESMKEFEEALD